MGSKDLKYIKNDPIWAQNGLKWAQTSKPKWVEKSQNKLKWALMSLNFTIKILIFTTDAYQCKIYMLQFLKRRNKCRK